MKRGTWLVERRSSDKPKVVTRHSGVSYACLLITVVRHLPPRARASALGEGRSHLHVSAELLAANTDEGTSCYHHEVPGLPDCSDDYLPRRPLDAELLTVLWKFSHIFFVNVDSELNIDSRPFHWTLGFACCYFGRSHSAEEHVRILLAMETFKSLHTQDKGERLQWQKACSATSLRISLCERVPSTTFSRCFT